MEYGLIGEKLGHSFSKTLHSIIADYRYDLKELAEDEVDGFFKEKDFKGLNVTIPYKRKVMDYLDCIDDSAVAIGAVNTIVNRNGKLYGYNTDCTGLEALLQKSGITVKDKKVLILGTGGASATANYVCTKLCAKEVHLVSRTRGEGRITYDEAYTVHSDAQVIINTTPVGMYPNVGQSPIDISEFSSLEGVADAIYNPISTSILLDAKKRNIKYANGFYMLVAQGVKAYSIFTDTEYSPAMCNKAYKKLFGEKLNIALIGMPASGKSTIGRMVAKSLNKEYIDTDDVIVEREGRAIKDIFATDGEEYFRKLESEIVAEYSLKNNLVISTGGGVILNECNIENLYRNSIVFFIDRPLKFLMPTGSRPLGNSKAKIEALYNQRYDKYLNYADYVVNAVYSKEENCKRIEEIFNEVIGS